MNERRASSLSNVLVIFGTLLQFESGAKRAHSKTWRNVGAPDSSRQRFGVRVLCAVFTLALAFFETSQLTTAAELTPNDVPPAIMREFRGAWIATVGNLNWPSKPGLPTEQQKAELRAILDSAVDLKLNAIVFQVRPACDALYKSDIEPWSEYLTGELGRAPLPFYDPLEFAIAEAHVRGLELHAWFNPYRAGMLPHKTPVPAKHITRIHPILVRKYGACEWLDPGEDAVKEYTARVILDVVRRYDIDGVHLDDYFYPYKEKDSHGNVIDFPDDHSWNAYRKRGGHLDRADWRRKNVNDLIERLHIGIHRIKPWVRFGISPFGIWRPGFPSTVVGFDAFDGLYADSRLWLREGWVDYFSPQLYWKMNAPKQGYAELLNWWLSENPKNRYVWPGSTLSGLGKGGPNPWTADDIVQQFSFVRSVTGNPGHLIWNFNRIQSDQSGVRTALARLYNEPAVSPPFTWLDAQPPAKPVILTRPAPELKTTFQWGGSDMKKPWLWALQTRLGNTWTTEIIPGTFNARTFTRDKTPDIVCLIEIDRCGNASPPALIRVGEAVTKQAAR
jgi:uncharacterized lipoprotein YddW (UPF0748 family)